MVRSLGLACALSLLAPGQARAGRLVGEVVISTARVLSVRSAQGVEVVQATEGTDFAGAELLEELLPGTLVEVEWAREISGVKTAESIKAPPRWSLVERSRVLDPQAAAHGLIVPSGQAPAFLAVDVRAVARFEEGHLPGAMSVPVERIGTIERSVPDRTRPLLVYSEDDRCELAPRAFRALRAAGYTDVRVLEGGFRAWWRALLRSVIEPGGLARALKRGDRRLVVDVRPSDRIATGSIPGAVAVKEGGLDPRRFAGRAVDPPLVLVGEDRDDPVPQEIAARIEGFRAAWDSPADAPVAILSGGLRGWREAGGAVTAPVSGIPDELAEPRRGEIGLAEFDRHWNAGAEAKGLMVDVRPRRVQSPSWALHLPLEELAGELATLPKDKEIVLFCSVGRRSAIAYEILKKRGLKVRFLRGAPPR